MSSEEIKEVALIIPDFAGAEALSLEDQAAIRSIGTATDSVNVPGELLKEGPVVGSLLAAELNGSETASTQSATVNQTKNEENTDIRFLIKKMTIPQKLKLALFGNATCRMILIMDKSKLVSMAVLKNARIQVSELEDFAKNPNIPAEILRALAASRELAKSNRFRFNLATNPKTPQDVGLGLLRYLMVNQLKMISRSKQIPQVVANTARRILAEKTKPEH
ncbi:MAG TPA: hypothetical protein PKD37_05925 [Oligoflexia bacterium]|nr:hypothetical protein [Oligoflexia bacterium]HMP27499.1 hypothetical protein [Oligoflexia bacterium]